MLIIYVINSLSKDILSKFINFRGGIQLGGVVNILENRIRIKMVEFSKDRFFLKTVMFF